MKISSWLDEINALSSYCEKHDGIRLKLNLDMLKSRTESDDHHLLYYEGDQLIGFLGIYPFGSTAELCGMVHPNYRRKGIFTGLVEEGLKRCREKKYKKILLNTPANSESGKQFLSKIPCQYQKTEYQMKWKEQPISDEGKSQVSIRTATGTDLETEILLDIQCFGFTEEDARKMNQRIKHEGSQISYMIDYKDHTVGKIRVEHVDQDAWLFEFAIFPEWQGKGIGRKALTQITKREAELGYDVFLEVEPDNDRALKLYQSCGYQTFQAQDYYLYHGDI